MILLDLDFQGVPGTIASYLVPHRKGALLVESGPGSTIPKLKEQLSLHGFSPAQITDCLVTHIHLDHGGAAGWLARNGTQIHVHPNGAPHLINPEKLISSASRIYKDEMQTLWGDFLPVQQENIVIHDDEEIFSVEDISIQTLEMVGHANHHFAYIINGICFSGDSGGVRLSPHPFLRLPMPPPDINLESWLMSIDRLKNKRIDHIAPTHFGLFLDADQHLSLVREYLSGIVQLLEDLMPGKPNSEQIAQEILAFEKKQRKGMKFTDPLNKMYELTNPTWMSVVGLQRYWGKYKSNGKPS